MRLEILNLIYKMKSAYFGVLSQAVDIPLSDLRAILNNLIHEGYLYPVIDVNGPYELTSKGRELRIELSLLEQKNQNNNYEVKEQIPDSVTKPEKYSRHDFKVSVIGEVISVLIGKLIELLHVVVKLILSHFFIG